MENGDKHGAAKEVPREKLTAHDPLSAAFSFPQLPKQEQENLELNDKKPGSTSPKGTSEVAEQSDSNKPNSHQTSNFEKTTIVHESSTSPIEALPSSTNQLSTEVPVQAKDPVASSESSLSKQPIAGILTEAGTGVWLVGESLQLRALKIFFLPPNGNPVPGTLLVTSFKLQFFPERNKNNQLYWIHQDDSCFRVPLGCINQVQPVLSNSVRMNNALSSKKRNGETDTLVIKCKDLRHLVFRFPDCNMANRTELLLRQLAFPQSGAQDDSWFNWLFAFAHGKSLKKCPPKFQIETEFARQGALTVGGPQGKLFRIANLNSDFKFSPTYPRRFLVPSTSGDLELHSVGEFRSRARVPALVWYDKVRGGSIWRCSQPKVGIGNNSVEDERMFEAIRLRTPCAFVSIMDCRPYKSAVANKAKGMGFEDDARYHGCSISFHNIENIHTVRSSWKRIESLATKVSAADGSSWYSQVESTGWLNHIRAILLMAVSCAEQVGKRGISAVVHCSDGWDRTAQTISLAQLLLDPYFRTIEGFQVLVEKDWIEFGHKFRTRIGAGSGKSDDSDRSPVFLQFLDCVWQLSQMFPKMFEFNAKLLDFLADAVYSCRFGDFLADNVAERNWRDLDRKTASLWSVVGDNLAEFKNPLFFATPEQVHPRPSVVTYQVRIWDQLLKYCATPMLLTHAFQNNGIDPFQ